MAAVTWKPDFESYAAQTGNWPLWITLDLAVADVAPIPDRPWRLSVRAELKSPNDDDMPEEAESAQLDALGTKVVETMEGFGHTFVGSVLGLGGVEWVFFTLDGVEDNVQNLLDALDALSESYELEPTLFDEDDWSFYFDFLYPDAFTKLRIDNHRRVDEMPDVPDDSEVRVTHRGAVPDEESASSVSTVLREAGFEVSKPRRSPGKAELGLRIVKPCSMSNDAIDEACWEIWSALSDIGGTYEGWDVVGQV